VPGAPEAQGIGAAEIAKVLGIGRASVYRVLESRHWPPVWASVALTAVIAINKPTI
jgi:DNA invertase Pin-like site-specific DNA recombinase